MFIRLIACVLFFPLSIFSGNDKITILIGKTKSQIKEYWAVKIPIQYFLETEPNEFVIMRSNVGMADFEAKFDEKGKCFYHCTKLYYEHISIIQARLIKEGWKYDSVNKIRIDPTKKMFAFVNQENLYEFSITVGSIKNKLDILASRTDFNKIQRQKEQSDSISKSHISVNIKKEAIDQPKKETREIFTIVENNAEFPGGLAAMMKYIQQNVQYPDTARKYGVSGKCFLQFVVNETGKISDIEVKKGVPGCPDCDKEAVRVVNGMPSWKPALLNGRAVNCYFNLPFSFKIQ